MLESLPSLCCGRYDHVWGPIEIVCIAFFTVEYVLRFASCPRYFPLDNPPDEQTTTGSERVVVAGSLRQHVIARIRFATNVLNLIDVLAIVPFYVELFHGLVSTQDESNETSFFRICRLLRVVRLLKLSKYSEGLQIMGETLRRSAGSLGMLLLAESIMVIILSTLAYFAERGSLCTDANDFCQGSAEPKLGIAGQVPEIGYYAEHGFFAHATYAGCSPDSAYCRRRSEIGHARMPLLCVLRINLAPTILDLKERMHSDPLVLE